MVPKESLRQYLEDKERFQHEMVQSYLKKGSFVPRLYDSKGRITRRYIIDDPDIDMEIDTKGDDSIVPYFPLFNSLKSPSSEKIHLGKVEKLQRKYGLNILPFSIVFNKGIGICTEKAILTQLKAQRRAKSFLVNGMAYDALINSYGAHTYNIVFIEDNPLFYDVSSPFQERNGKLEPCIMPIKGVGAFAEKNEIFFEEDIDYRKYFLP